MSSRAHLHVPHSLGERVADLVAATVGSWRFIIVQSTLLAFWLLLNSLALFAWKWDPAPFILLNLCLSFQAAYTGPVVMMSQNRQAAKDRTRDDLEADEVSRLLALSSQIYTLSQEVHALTSAQTVILEELRGHDH